MLNRRNALTAAATLPALAVPAAVAGARPVASERKLLALEANIYRAWEHLDSNILAEAEGRFWEWETANPKPKMREATKQEALAFFQSGYSTMGAEYEQASAEHDRAMAEWEARHEAAKEDTGYNRAHELETAANDRLDAAIMAMCDTPATTMEGLRCKARAAAKVDGGNLESDLAWSIVDDLRDDIA
jgi:hypothetical protein